MSAILVSAPPKDTPFFDKRSGRISQPWLDWFGSVTSTATIVQTLQVSSVIAEDNSTDGNSSEILTQLTDLVALLAEPRRAPETPAVDLLPALDAPVNAWRGEADELRAMIAAGLEASQAWRAEADELRALIAAETINFGPSQFDAAGAAAAVQSASLQVANNLSDVSNAAGAVTNLGLGSLAWVTATASGVAAGTATTVYTFPSGIAAVYLVSARLGNLTGDTTDYAATATIAIDNGSARIMSSVAGNLLTISLSGMALQLKQSSGVAQPVLASILKIG